MKRTILLILAAIVAFIPGISAQEVSIELGAWSKLHYVSYDKKGNVDGFFRKTIQKREALEGDTVVYTIRTTFFDEKYVPVKGENDRDFAVFSTMKFTPDELVEIIDVRKMIPQEAFDAGVTITIDDQSKGIPRRPQVGPLPDYSVKAELTYQQYHLPIEATCSERTVECQEKVKTDAGEFDCWKFREKTNTIMGDRRELSVKESWYAPVVGLVRSVTYTTSGKVTATVELQQADILPVKKSQN